MHEHSTDLSPASSSLRSDPALMREYKRQWVAKRRADWFAANGPCVRCGSWDRLELDHIDRTQKVDHKVWSWSVKRRDAEIAKCQVLCRPCHIHKGQEVGDIPPESPHGGKSRYERHGCRCDACRAWKSAKSARQAGQRVRRK